jgi:hypothetical protein
MSERRLQFRGGTAAACLALAAAIAACLGDDSTTTPGTDAGSDHSSNVTPDASLDTSMSGTGGNGTGGGGTGTGGTAGGGTGGSMAADASDGRAGDARAEAAPDAPRDVTTPSDVSDASARDVTPDNASSPDVGSDATDASSGDGNDGAVPVLSMCVLFDQWWGITTDAGGCADQTQNGCPDRANTWATDISNAYAGPGQPLTVDCRINSMFMQASDPFQYSIDFLSWPETFFGCPDLSGPYPTRTYALVPPGLESIVFTTADFALLSGYFEQAVVDAVAGAPNGPSGGLTAGQRNAIRAELARLSATLSPSSSPVYTFDMCPADGGTD